jgi:hypothetical protein
MIIDSLWVFMTEIGVSFGIEMPLSNLMLQLKCNHYKICIIK